MLSTCTSYPELQKNLQRERAKARPENLFGLKGSYKSIFQLAKHLDEHPEDLTTTASDGTVKQLKHKLIQSSSKTFHLFFYDPETMAQFTDHENQMDGTFHSIPQVKGVGQLFTLMGKKYNVVSFFHKLVPFFWQRIFFIFFNNSQGAQLCLLKNKFF